MLSTTRKLSALFRQKSRHIIHLSVDMAVYVRCDVGLVMFVLNVGLVMITTVIAFNFFSMFIMIMVLTSNRRFIFDSNLIHLTALCAHQNNPIATC